MARRFPLKAVAIGGVLAGGLGILALARRKTKPLGRVALIGDSYAVGLGPELQKLFPEFRYEGHVGTRTSDWANHSKVCGTCGDWITKFSPSDTFVSLGVNDGASPNPSDYQTIARALHGVGTRVIWIEPPEGVNAPKIRKIIRSLGVTIVPATTTTLSSDGLHPISYKQWAQETAGAIRQL